jgi:thiamine biosynthesis lipoprotein
MIIILTYFTKLSPLSLLLALSIPARPATPSTWVEREIVVMGTTLRIGAHAVSRASAIAAIEAAFTAVRAADSLLSTWRDDTELARLNRSPLGVPAEVTPALARILVTVDRWSRATGDAFDPAIGALEDAWDLRGRGRVPSTAELAHARERSGRRAFRLSADGRRLSRLIAGAWLDSGGFGKGAALAAARDSLAARGITSAVLDFGGQVLALGADAGGRPWAVPVAHPSHRIEPVARLALRDRSASTSAQSERFVKVGGRRYGHIIDPRTGLPVPAWGSVTVVATDPLVADILSTALLVLGPEAALRWARARPEIGVLVLEERQGRVRPRWSPGLKGFLVQDSTLDRGG